MEQPTTRTVVLKDKWPGRFFRPVRDGNGVKEVLEFTPGKPVALDDEQFAAIKGDIGHALEEVVAKQ